LEIRFTQEESSLSISTTKKGENPSVPFYQKDVLFPVPFLTDDMKKKFSELVDVDRKYVILDEFGFLYLFLFFLFYLFLFVIFVVLKYLTNDLFLKRKW
jgi:hypothetical protein